MATEYTHHQASEWSDVIVAAMKLGGVDNLFFVSGMEITFYQEAIAKARVLGTPAPRLVTMTHENVALNAALGNAMVRNQPAATAVHIKDDLGREGRYGCLGAGGPHRGGAPEDGGWPGDMINDVALDLAAERDAHPAAPASAK